MFKYLIIYYYLNILKYSVVGRGTTLQAGRSRVQDQMMSMNFLRGARIIGAIPKI
jgi:hypothetical protein